MRGIRRWALLLVLAGPASAGVDYACLSDCTGRGYLYQYCQQACSFQESPDHLGPRGQQKIKQTDYACVQDCTNNGYLYQYCVERCSY